MLSVPALPLALVISAFVEMSLPILIVVIGGVSWTGTARIVRAEMLSLREREFVVERPGARGARQSAHRPLHPAQRDAADHRRRDARRSRPRSSRSRRSRYLGYGIQPPVASLGQMLQNAQRYLRRAPELAVYPGLLISLTVVSINFVGDALRDALDPRAAARRTGEEIHAGQLSSAREITAARPSLAVLPIGSIEQHSRHLPLGTDWIAATALAHRVGAELGALVLPALPVSMGRCHKPMAGTGVAPPHDAGRRGDRPASARWRRAASGTSLIVNGHGGKLHAGGGRA